MEAAGDRLTITMLPLSRSGDVVTVTAQVRLDRADDDDSSSSVTKHFAASTAASFDNVRLVDPAGQRVYLVAPGADGGACACTGRTRIDVGATATLHAAFRGIPADKSEMSVMLPYAGVFADVPVQEGAAPLETVEQSHTAPLSSYTERLDVKLRSLTTADGVDLDLDTDLLFPLDSAKLAPASAKVLAAAAADIRAAGPGPLTVTGHTDSSGSTAHNQELSEQRAAAVATALDGRLPGKDWPRKVAGKGETAPAFPNDNAEHRQLNRRVTLSFKGTRKGKPVEAPLPATKGTTATATAGAEVALPLRRGTITFTASAATRHGPYVQVDLIARNTGAKDATILDYLGQGLFTVRDEFDPYARFGASGVRLLAGNTAGYNLDYLNADGRHRCLCDRQLNRPLPVGGTQTISLWFPDPGTPTVTLDVPDRFRLSGIAVG
ncbi:MAG: OmpA family protein [Actinoplanes sp.]